MSQRKSPRLQLLSQNQELKKKKLNTNNIPLPDFSDNSDSEDDLDDLFSNNDSITVFSDIKSYKQTNSHSNKYHHQITAPPSSIKSKRKHKKTQKRKRTASQFPTPKPKKYKISDDYNPSSSQQKSQTKRKKKEKRLSAEVEETIDFWKNLSNEKLVVKKKKQISPTKLTLCKQREDLLLTDSESEHDIQINESYDDNNNINNTINDKNEDDSINTDNSLIHTFNSDINDSCDSNDTNNTNNTNDNIFEDSQVKHSEIEVDEYSDTLESQEGLKGDSSPLFEDSD